MNQEELPIHLRRGIESIDLNDTMILVNTPIEKVAAAFAQIRQAEIWQRNVYKCDIEIMEQSFILLQFRGQAWTFIKRLTVTRNNRMQYQGWLKKEDAQALSCTLNTSAIYYTISDPGGTFEYHFYNDGTLVEKLCHEEEINTEFQSQLRALTIREIGNAYNFLFDFMVEQGVYVPMYLGQESFAIGERIILETPEIEDENLERIDYVALR